jgi:hypothetical protein
MSEDILKNEIDRYKLIFDLIIIDYLHTYILLLNTNDVSYKYSKSR